MKQFIYIFIISVLVVFSACEKEVGVDTLPYEPNIEIQSINTTNLIEFQDSLIIILKYEDGDGDLGRLDPDENSLYIKDKRLENPEYYHIPPIVPDDKTLQTTGTIRVFVPTLFVIGSGKSENTELELKVRDQAGNWSNSVSTGVITINKEN